MAAQNELPEVSQEWRHKKTKAHINPLVRRLAFRMCRQLSIRSSVEEVLITLDYITLDYITLHYITTILFFST